MPLCSLVRWCVHCLTATDTEQVRTEIYATAGFRGAVRCKAACSQQSKRVARWHEQA